MEQGGQLGDPLSVAGFRVLQCLLEFCALLRVVTLTHDHLLFKAWYNYRFAIVKLLSQVGDLGC